MIRIEIKSQNIDDALMDMAELGNASEALLRNIAAWKAEKAAARASAPAEVQPPEPTATAAPTATTAPETAPEPAETRKPTKPPKIEDVRAHAKDMARKYGRTAVKGILARLGAADVSSLPESKWTAFMTALDELKKKGGDSDT